MISKYSGQVLVTGGNGFIGSYLCHYLRSQAISVKQVVRTSSKCSDENCLELGNIDGSTNWQDTLVGIDTVVHLAARVHVMNDPLYDPLPEYKLINVDGTINLAKQAALQGVRRFVFLSSIKVNGEATFGKPFSVEDKPAPVDPYGQSKLEAEFALWQIAKETGLEVVVVRPPLVYGPGVKANFLRLLQWVKKAVPLPFACDNNYRSFISLDNIVSFLFVCIEHPAAAGRVFLVSDGEDLSTPELIRRIASHMHCSVRLIPVPLGLLRLGGSLFGKTAVVDRLCGSLQVDICKAEQILDWHPPVSVDDGLKKTVSWFLHHG